MELTGKDHLYRERGRGVRLVAWEQRENPVLTGHFIHDETFQDRKHGHDDALGASRWSLYAYGLWRRSASGLPLFGLRNPGLPHWQHWAMWFPGFSQGEYVGFALLQQTVDH